MRTLHLILAIVAFAFMAPVNVSAATAVDAKESRELIIKKLAAEKLTTVANHLTESKAVKKAAKLAKKFGFGADKVDFQSEPDKWLWYGVFGCAFGILFYTLGWGLLYPLWYIGHLCWVAGIVCLIVWFLKKNGAL